MNMKYFLIPLLIFLCGCSDNPKVGDCYFIKSESTTTYYKVVVLGKYGPVLKDEGTDYDRYKTTTYYQLENFFERIDCLNDFIPKKKVK